LFAADDERPRAISASSKDAAKNERPKTAPPCDVKDRTASAGSEK